MRFRRAARSLLLLGVILAGDASATVAGRAPEMPSHLPDAARARVQPVTEKPSLAVKIDGEPFVARRDVFEYLLDHPDFTTHITRALKFARYRIWRTPQGLGIDDGWGTVGTFELLHAVDGLRLMYARGVYQHKILPNIHGQAVVLIDYDVRPAAGGRSVINAAVTGFVRLDSRLLAAASKLATSVATAKGEKEARRLVKLFAKTAGAIEADPAGTFEKVRQSPGVPARELDEFRRLLNLGGAAAATPAPPPPASR